MLKKLMFAVLAGMTAFFAAAANAAPAPEVFGALPAISAVRISPSGKYFAIVQNTSGQTVVRTFDAVSGQQIGITATGQQQTIRNVIWHSDNRLLLFVVEVEKVDAHMEGVSGTNTCRIMSIARDGSNPVQLKISGMLSDATFTCSALALHGTEPDTVLLQGGVVSSSGMAAGPQARLETKVFSVNVETGDAKVVGEVGSRSTYNWAADATGKVRLRYDAVAGEEVLFARLDGSSDWKQVHRQPLFAFEAAKDSSGSTSSVIDVLGFSSDPNQVYVSYWPGDREAIGLFDLRTGQISVVADDPRFDIDGVVVLAHKVVGVLANRAFPEQEFFTEEWQKLQAIVKVTYPGHRVLIASSSDDLNSHVLYVEGPKWPGGAYMMVDLKAGQASLVGSRYPGIDQASTGDQKYITYTARDGTKIDAYLTLPRGAGKNLPTIILPHGGPEARDEGGFDWLSQFFVSRGYAVLQPQYRGSTGYGTKFALAGRKQWGLKMQDDVSDGVKHLVASGIADPNKTCIMGWSYGGYASMAGATLTPDLYRCAIAGAGVSDLGEMLLWEGKYGGGSLRYWRQHIGDPTADKAAIEAASPAKHVDRVKGPMLLIHGELDSVVPIKQSEIMADALKAAGKQYEFVRLADENHNITFASTRIKTLKAMDEFLAKYNPAH